MEEIESSASNDQYPQALTKKEVLHAKKNAIIITGVIFAVCIVAVVLLGALVIIPLSKVQTHAETTTPPQAATSIANLPPGASCTASSECVPGCFCNGNKVCATGAALAPTTPCVANSECAVGSYCSGGNLCVPGVGWTTGGPCDNPSDCQVGYTCDSGACTAASVTPIPSACTSVPVYNALINSTITGLPHVNSITDVSSSTLYFLSSAPIFTACSNTGSGKIPIYIWEAGSVDDIFYSTSNSAPFTNGTQGYTLGNSGNPIFYLYGTQYENTMPVYKLQGFSFQDATNYHCLSLFTMLVQNLPQDKNVTYQQNILDADNGILGYALLS